MCQWGSVLASDSSSAEITTKCYDKTSSPSIVTNVIAEKKKYRFLATHSLWVEFLWYLSNNPPPPPATDQLQHAKLSLPMSQMFKVRRMESRIFPFARACHKATRQLGPHVTTRAISNMACLYEHSTSTSDKVWWLVVISLSVQSERIGLLQLALVSPLRANNQLCQWCCGHGESRCCTAF